MCPCYVIYIITCEATASHVQPFMCTCVLWVHVCSANHVQPGPVMPCYDHKQLITANQICLHSQEMTVNVTYSTNHPTLSQLIKSINEVDRLDACVGLSDQMVVLAMSVGLAYRISCVKLILLGMADHHDYVWHAMATCGWWPWTWLAMAWTGLLEPVDLARQTLLAGWTWLATAGCKELLATVNPWLSMAMGGWPLLNLADHNWTSVTQTTQTLLAGHGLLLAGPDLAVLPWLHRLCWLALALTVWQWLCMAWFCLKWLAYYGCQWLELAAHYYTWLGYTEHHLTVMGIAGYVRIWLDTTEHDWTTNQLNTRIPGQ